LKKNPKFKQGIFSPIHKEKYKGTFPIIYRSGLELRFMRWVDSNSNILSWGSESVIIPYQNPLTGRVSRYFTDFNVTLRNKNGQIEKFIVEIKPSSQTVPPNQKQKNKKTLMRQQAEYVKNQAKWLAATAFCESKNSRFIIITEKHLGM
jgi:hypothetical protein